MVQQYVFSCNPYNPCIKYSYARYTACTNNTKALENPQLQPAGALLQGSGSLGGAG